MCVLEAIGIALSVAGSLASGAMAQANAEAQARAYEQQARADSQASAYEQAREKHKQDLLAAQARAQVGASGVGFQGSPTEVLVANAREGQMDLQAIQYGSQIRQNNLRDQAAISRFQGKQAKAAGFINAGSNVISGLSGLYDPSRASRFGGSVFR